ncbi:hypothetical protein TUM1881_17300 [Escherichia coli]|nr:hypothetical protein TUM1881_17300 [Escherichia coli]
MLNHTTHPQGRDSHNLNKYIWRFIALSTAQPRVIHIVATSEQEARQQSPAGCVMVFAARIRQGCIMCNNTRPDAVAEAIKTLIDALIDISCTAATAEKHITREPEYTGAIIPHSLAYAQLTADMALNEARAILIADCENGGVMRDDRFNALKQEFDGAPDDTGDALLAVNDLIKAACFLIGTAEHSGTGNDILIIASNYAEYVAEARYRRKFTEDVSHG